jgi:BirA family transcriptional regulator, biotin operon repressor / biotin---[acetyl-CoA-carboxylase] ligase
VTERTKHFHLDTVGSTNAHAAQLLTQGEAAPFWITADKQTAGRGRDNRLWISEPGNLYASHALRIDCPPQAVPQVSLVAALAVFDCISNWIPADQLRLKWPNDCLSGNAKISGILVESPGLKPPVVIIGCGINVGFAPSGLPYPVTSIAERSTAILQDVFLKLDETMSSWLKIWQNGAQYETVRTAWMKRSWPLGHEITIRQGDRSEQGYFRGLNEHGALLLESSDGTIQAHYSGDVGQITQ